MVQTLWSNVMIPNLEKSFSTCNLLDVVFHVCFLVSHCLIGDNIVSSRLTKMGTATYYHNVTWIVYLSVTVLWLISLLKSATDHLEVIVPGVQGGDSDHGGVWKFLGLWSRVKIPMRVFVNVLTMCAVVVASFRSSTLLFICINVYKASSGCSLPGLPFL